MKIPMTGRRVAIAVAILALIAVPYAIKETYYVNIASQILLYAIFALGLNVLVGYAGLVSLGHAGLFGVAAYVVAYLLAAGHGHALRHPRRARGRAGRHCGLRRTGAARDRHQLHHDYACARRNHLGPGLSLDQPHQRRQRHQRGDAAGAVRTVARPRRAVSTTRRLSSSCSRLRPARSSCARRSAPRCAAPATSRAA